MNYEVILGNGTKIMLENAVFDVTEFTTQLNNHNIMFVNIGGHILQKGIIQAINPIQSTTKAE